MAEQVQEPTRSDESAAKLIRNRPNRATGGANAEIAMHARASNHEISVLDRAIEVIGDKNEAMRWMGTPVRDLDYSTPVSLLGTRKGRQSVMVVLGRLEHGVL